jgi:hypothetical protein
MSYCSRCGVGERGGLCSAPLGDKAPSNSPLFEDEFLVTFLDFNFGDNED